MGHKIVKIAVIVSAFFGLLTVLASGSLILDLFGMREKEGDYILFVVWANLICGVLYLLASYGFFKQKNWTTTIMEFSVWVLVAAIIVLFFWILNGEPYENKTIIAMTFRISLTLGLLWIARSFKLRIKN